MWISVLNTFLWIYRNIDILLALNLEIGYLNKRRYLNKTENLLLITKGVELFKMLNSGPIHQRTGQSFLKFLFELRALGVKSLTSYLQRFPTHIGIDTLISPNINKFIRFIFGVRYLTYMASPHIKQKFLGFHHKYKY